MRNRTGKSVCSILVPHDGFSTLRETSGLYTSPHLVAVRERIRIGGDPLSEEDFTKYFFDVWDKLQKNGVSAIYMSVGCGH